MFYLDESVKPGSHLCDKHNTSDISISISTRKKGTCSFFLVLMLMSLVLCLLHKCEPGVTLVLLYMSVFCVYSARWCSMFHYYVEALFTLESLEKSSGLIIDDPVTWYEWASCAVGLPKHCILYQSTWTWVFVLEVPLHNLLTCTMWLDHAKGRLFEESEVNHPNNCFHFVFSAFQNLKRLELLKWIVDVCVCRWYLVFSKKNWCHFQKIWGMSS